MRRPDLQSRGAFVMIAFAGLAATLGAGVLLADPVIAGLRVFVEPLARLSGLAHAVHADGQGGWLLTKSIPAVIGGAPAMAEATLALDAPTLRLRLRGVPVLVALMLAPPWPSGFWPGGLWRGLATGLACMMVVFILSVLASIYYLGAVAAEQAAGLAPGGAAAGGLLTGGEAAQAGGHMARLVNHVGVYVAPLLAPVLLWAWLKPEGLRFLLGRPAQPQQD